MRWSVSAARKGWRVVGLDPSIGALAAARRAFGAEGLDIAFVCGDARFLLFKPGVFQTVFSYSVIQRFSESDAEIALAEAGRVLATGGHAKIQMAHQGGLRSTYIRTRPDYMASGVFRVRYWSLADMKRAFTSEIGETRIDAEAFGGLGLLVDDWKIVSGKAKALIVISTCLKWVSRLVRPLIRVADSVYISATRR